jgi:hypothetical protein
MMLSNLILAKIDKNLLSTTTQSQEKELNLKCGDLILFSGNSNTSFLIELSTLSRWSHVGMILKDPGTNKLYIYDATTSTGHVTLSPLKEKLLNYDGYFKIRKLRTKLSDKTELAMWDFMNRTVNIPFENNKFDMLNAGVYYWTYKIPFMPIAFELFGKTEDDRTFFCTELIVKMLKTVAGFNMCGRRINTFVPADFSSDSSCDLLNAFSFRSKYEEDMYIHELYVNK